MKDLISSFVHNEARLLDEWRLDEWLDLFAEDGIYWVPIDETKDPGDYPSITYDDKGSLSSRVALLTKFGARATQSPRSETIHFITNLDVSEGKSGSMTANYNCLISEFRSGYWRQNGMGVQRLFPSRCRLELIRGPGGLMIKEKRVVLLNRSQPIDGLTVIF